MKKKNINIALSPNNTFADTLQALWQIIFPFHWFFWKKGHAVGTLEKEFQNYLNVPYAFATGSGREALFIILQALKRSGHIQEGDEIILQSFTCMVVINSIVWNKLTPVYVDIKAQTYNLDPEKLEEKITGKTKVVMVQHTFGIGAEMQRIKEICMKHKLILIEDCAHALGAEVTMSQEYNQKLKKEQKLGNEQDNSVPVGIIGDIGFYSLGRSKVISCVQGGMIVTRNEKLAQNLSEIVEDLPYPSMTTIFKNLFHPIVCSLAKVFYNFLGLGKMLLIATQKMKLLTMEVTQTEKSGQFQKPYPTLLPNALAKLALIQFKQLQLFNEKRKKIAAYYYQELKDHPGLHLVNPQKYPGAIFLRYPLQFSNAGNSKAAHLDKVNFLSKAKTQGIILGDWYSSAIAPKDINMEKTFYSDQDCPVTEKVCSQVINLPTHQSLKQKDLESIVELFKITK